MTGYQKRVEGRKLSIGIATIPNRKKLCLVVSDGNVITKYATFTNNESAYEFMDIFADFIDVERHEWFGRGVDGWFDEEVDE